MVGAPKKGLKPLCCIQSFKLILHLCIAQAPIITADLLPQPSGTQEKLDRASDSRWPLFTAFKSSNGSGSRPNTLQTMGSVDLPYGRDLFIFGVVHQEIPCCDPLWEGISSQPADLGRLSQES